MHIEFFHLLNSCLEDTWQILQQQNGLLPQTSLPAIQIQKPPPDVKGVITSNVSFLACDAVKGGTNCEILPEEMARILLQSAQRITEGVTKNIPVLFVLSLGGAGFINANLSDRFRSLFLDEVERTEGRILFSRSSILDKQAGEDFGSFREVFASWFSSYSVDRFPKVKSDLMLLEQEDGLITSKQWIMILGVLADREIDPYFYLQCMRGKQNVPWYLNQFLKDSGTFLTSLNQFVECKRGCQMVDVDLFLKSSEQSMFSFRESFFHSITTRQPSELLGAMLQAIHGFYRFYNHPTVRGLNILPEISTRVRQLTIGSRAIVVEGLNVLGLE